MSAIKWSGFERPQTFNTAMSMLQAEHLPPGLFLVWLREEAGKTLRGVAEEVGVSAPYWSDVEHGRRGLAAERYTAVATALGTSWETIARVMDFLPCGQCGRSGPRPRAAPSKTSEGGT